MAYLRRSKRPQYEEALHRLVDRLVDLEARSRNMPPARHLPDLSQVQSAFGPASKQVEPQGPDSEGVRRVDFVIIAGRRDEMRQVRNVVDSYGAGAVDWRPYSPSGRIGATAQRIAAELNLTSGFLSLDSELSHRLARARAANNLVIFIVDPWTITIPQYRELIQAYDREHHYNCALLIPWPEDPETRNNRMHLEESISLSFVTKTTMRDPHTFRDGVESSDRLEVELRESLVYAMANVLRAADVVRRAKSNRVISKPWITGPGGA